MIWSIASWLIQSIRIDYNLPKNEKKFRHNRHGKTICLHVIHDAFVFRTYYARQGEKLCTYRIIELWVILTLAKLLSRVSSFGVTVGKLAYYSSHLLVLGRALLYRFQGCNRSLSVFFFYKPILSSNFNYRTLYILWMRLGTLCSTYGTFLKRHPTAYPFYNSFGPYNSLMMIQKKKNSFAVVVDRCSRAASIRSSFVVN